MIQFNFPPIVVDKTGLATSGNQAAEIASLASIDTKTPALGQALAAASTPVVLTAAQLSTLTPLSTVNVGNFPPDSDSLAQASATSGQLGSLVMGASTTAAPAYTTGQTNPLSLSLAGGLRVDGSSVTQPVSGSVAVSNFPASQAVTGTFFQATQPVSIAASVAVTGPLTDTQLRATAVPVSGTVSTGGLTDTQLRATAVPVSLTSTTITNFPATQAVSAASLPLPTGAATETTLAALNTKVTAVNTGAVTISTALPAGANSIGAVTANAGTNLNTSLLALDSTLTGGTAKAVVRSAAKGTTVAADVTSTPVDANTQALDVFVKGTNGLTDAQLRASAVPVSLVSTTVTNTVAVSGAVTANIGTTNGLALDTSVNTLLKPASTLAAVTTVGTVSAVTAITNALPTGANVIGALTANQSVNISQIAGTAVGTSAGTVATNSQRIVVGSAATATTANIAGAITSATALAASTSRLGASFYNDSTSNAYLKFGATASATSYTVKLLANDYYEIPGPHVYNGNVDVIWDTATGALRVTGW